MAVELDPDALKLQFTLAQTYLKAGQPALAKAALEELLKRDPQYPQAKELLESTK